MIDIYANSFKVQDLLFTLVVLIYMRSVYLTVFTFDDYEFITNNTNTTQRFLLSGTYYQANATLAITCLIM